MNEKRFIYGETDLFEWVEDNGQVISTKECVNKLNEQQDTIITLRRRLEKINGGYALLPHRNGLTPNEWVIESQERELKKKDEQISDWIERHSKDIAKISEQQSTISDLKEENEQLQKKNKFLEEDVDDYHNALFDLHKKYDKLEKENEQLRRLFEEKEQPITINLTEEDAKELRKLLGLIDDE